MGNQEIGVISLSKSGDLALSLASYLPGIGATVWINGCSCNTLFPLYYKKHQILSILTLDLSTLTLPDLGARISKHITNPQSEEYKSSQIPIEQATGHFLFVAAEADLNWNSKFYMDEMVERLRCHGKYNFESVSYPEAGHFLEPPYGPYCPSSLHNLVGKPVMWGGEPRSHAAAEVHMWKKIQEFFSTHLSCEETQAKL